MRADSRVILTLLLSVAGLGILDAQQPPPRPVIVNPDWSGKTGVALSCIYCSLHGMDLSGRQLTDANLTGADLSGANLKGTVLNGAILAGANLTDADLSGAQLNASARGPADLTRANAAGANFQNASMHGAHLFFAILEGANFDNADMSGAAIGPHPKTGVRNGHATSFRNAKIERQFMPDSATTDVNGAQWIEPKRTLGASATPDGIACGNSDVSHLASIVYVSGQGKDAAGCGTKPANACQTFSYGISRCGANGCNILAMYDEYQFSSTLGLNSTSIPKGAHLYGGCL